MKDFFKVVIHLKTIITSYYAFKNRIDVALEVEDTELFSDYLILCKIMTRGYSEMMQSLKVSPCASFSI